MLRFYLPEVTYGKALLAEESDEGNRHAEAFASRFLDTARKAHNRRCTIEALLIRAVARQARGNDGQAGEDLRKALALAEPGAMVRPFLDFGEPMKAALASLVSPDALPFTSDVLARFAAAGAWGQRVDRGPDLGAPSASRAVDLLTNREFEVLTLLTDRLSNKAIARRMFVSPETVKKHLFNVYHKLDVHGRREAVRRAGELGIL